MKKIIFLLAFLPALMQAQNFAELVKAYEKECAQIVKDTIEQTGTVKYDYVPVLDAAGKISHYALGSPDTTWQTPDCPEFKHDLVGYYTGGSIIWNTSTPNLGYNLNISSQPLAGSEKMEQHTVKITRQYVCEVKLRKVGPFSQHFWEWLKERK